MNRDIEMIDYLVGIDDTDIPGSPGTGRLARDLSTRLARAGGTALGITRHQLARLPTIPYTSRNSAACLRIRWAEGMDFVADFVEEFLRDRYVQGADPGLAVGTAQAVSPELIRLAHKAKTERIELSQIESATCDAVIAVRSVAGARVGIVGAAAALALRASGNDGRFIDLPGIRDDWVEATVGEILDRTAIDRVVDDRGRAVDFDRVVAIDGWLRPSLLDQAPVLVVTPGSDDGKLEIYERPAHRKSGGS